MEGRIESKRKAGTRLDRLLLEADDTIRDFCRLLKAKEKSSQTCISYVSYVLRFKKYMDARNRDYLRAEEIDIYEFLNSFKIGADGQERTISYSYSKTAWSALRKFFEFLVDREVIAKNPMKLGDRPSGSDPINNVYLTEEEINMMINKADKEGNLMDKLIIMLLLNTGLRVGALTNLNVEDFNVSKSLLYAEDKGGKRDFYPLTPKICSLMQQWIKERGVQESPALFINHYHQRISEKYVERMVKKYSVDIPKVVTPHKLRATYATMLYKSTKDIRFVQERMHHSNVITTQRYIKAYETEEEENRKVLNILEKIGL